MTQDRKNPDKPTQAGLVELSEEALDQAAGAGRKFDHIGNITAKLASDDSQGFTDTIMDGSNI